MIAPLRRAHRWIWVVLGPVLVLLLALALEARDDPPPEPAPEILRTPLAESDP